MKSLVSNITTHLDDVPKEIQLFSNLALTTPYSELAVKAKQARLNYSCNIHDDVRDTLPLPVPNVVQLALDAADEAALTSALKHLRPNLRVEIDRCSRAVDRLDALSRFWGDLATTLHKAATVQEKKAKRSRKGTFLVTWIFSAPTSEPSQSSVTLSCASHAAEIARGLRELAKELQALGEHWDRLLGNISHKRKAPNLQDSESASVLAEWSSLMDQKLTFGVISSIVRMLESTRPPITYPMEGGTTLVPQVTSQPNPPL